jgi:hypothetical protein
MPAMRHHRHDRPGNRSRRNRAAGLPLPGQTTGALLAGVLLGVLSALVAACGVDAQRATGPVTAPIPMLTPTLPIPSVAATASPSNPPSMSPTATLAAPTAPPGPAAWFEDRFDTDRGWLVADSGRLAGAVEAGTYVLRPLAGGEPAYAWAPKEGAIGSALMVEALLTFPAAGSALAGLAVADLEYGVRLVILLGAGGEWRLQRDDATAFRTLASGRAAGLDAGTPVVLKLVLEDGGTASAWLAGRELGRAAVEIDVGHVGLAAQAAADGVRIPVDDFRATLGA